MDGRAQALAEAEVSDELVVAGGFHPLVTALGVGLASAIKGRNPLIDGFGLIAFASLMPMILVLLFGMLWQAPGAP